MYLYGIKDTILDLETMIKVYCVDRDHVIMICHVIQSVARDSNEQLVLA